MSLEPRPPASPAAAAEELAALVAALFSPLAHDLRASLNGISVWTHLLGKDADEVTVRALEGIRRSVAHQSTLAQELSQLGAALAAQRAAPDSQGDLAAACRRVVDELRAAHPDREITVDAAASVQVAAHPDLLLQLVRMLLADLVTATTAAEPLHVTAASAGGDAVLEAGARSGEPSSGARRRTLRQALGALAAGMARGRLDVDPVGGVPHCVLRLPTT
jgi:signal transduction histidine kinase